MIASGKCEHMNHKTIQFHFELAAKSIYLVAIDRSSETVHSQRASFCRVPEIPDQIELCLPDDSSTSFDPLFSPTHESFPAFISKKTVQ